MSVFLVTNFRTLASTSNFNVALNESGVIKHLCNCNGNILDWYFIHQEARSIEPSTKRTDLGFIPPNVIYISLLFFIIFICYNINNVTFQISQKQKI